MNMNRGALSRGASAAAAILLFAVLAAAQSAPQQEAAPDLSASGVRIKNFGRMDERFYRGARPKKEDYKDLAAMGIKTVIDLQDDPRDYARQLVEALGMRYVNIPMSDKDYPKEEQIDAFLKIAQDPSTGKFFVHCAGGRHRTGVVGAVYRFNFDRWDFDRAYREMKAYDFYTRWGHGAMKRYVEDYWKRIQAGDAPATSDAAPPQSNAAAARSNR